MKKTFVLGFITFILLSNMVFAAPMPREYYYQFQPNGEAFHYYYFGDECFEEYKLDGKDNNSGAIVDWLPNGIEWDGFERKRVAINGEDRTTNIRYKIDEENFDAYPKENAYAPFIITFENQIKDTVVDNESKTITLYYPRTFPTTNLKFDLWFTGFGIATYRAFNLNDINRGIPTAGGEVLVSNRVKNYDEVFNSLYLKEDEYKTLINSIKHEYVNYSNETYLYIVSGQYQHKAYKWKINLVGSDEKFSQKIPRCIPKQAQFDKRTLYSSNVIINILDNDSVPQKLYANGSEVTKEGNYAFDENYLIISRNYLNSYHEGDKITFRIEFENQKTATMNVEIKDTTSSAYVKCFDDVGTQDGYWEFINPLFEKQIIKGSGSGYYRPNDNITYAEFCVILARVLGVPEKSGENWYDWAVQGIINSGIFTSGDMDAPITSEQAECMFINALGYQLNQAGVKFPALSIYTSYTIDDKRYYVSPQESDAHIYFALPMIDPMKAVKGENLSRAEAAEAIYKYLKLFDLIKTHPTDWLKTY